LCRLRCISRIDSYLFKVEVAKKLKMKVTFVDCVCVNLQSREVVVVEKTARGRGVYGSCDFVGTTFPLFQLYPRTHPQVTVNKYKNDLRFQLGCRKALEKARIEWESAKTVVEELKEWRRGLKALWADTLAKLKKATPELQHEMLHTLLLEDDLHTPCFDWDTKQYGDLTLYIEY
ncbi:hypothetical protein Tco_0870957, partial [Tanacetum coccineum]